MMEKEHGEGDDMWMEEYREETRGWAGEDVERKEEVKAWRKYRGSEVGEDCWEGR